MKNWYRLALKNITFEMKTVRAMYTRQTDHRTPDLTLKTRADPRENGACKQVISMGTGVSSKKLGSLAREEFPHLESRAALKLLVSFNQNRSFNDSTLAQFIKTEPELVPLYPSSLLPIYQPVSHPCLLTSRLAP
jgi:hypothetical protein